MARVTDKGFPMKKVSYGGDWRDWDHKSTLGDHEAQQQAAGYPLFFHDPQNDFRFRIGTPKDTDDWQHIVCEEPYEKFLPTKKTIDLNAKKEYDDYTSHTCMHERFENNRGQNQRTISQL